MCVCVCVCVCVCACVCVCVCLCVCVCMCVCDYIHICDLYIMFIINVFDIYVCGIILYLHIG